MVVGSVAVSLFHLGRANDMTKLRFTAHMRADAALDNIRRDLTSIIRDEDLFYTYLDVRSDSVNSPIGRLDNDDVLMFSTRLRTVRDVEYQGEGSEYETQYRIQTDDLGPVLWQRLDPFPDEYPHGGGVATPLVEGIVSLQIECYDGFQWYRDWDSDRDGLPWAVRVTVMATGTAVGEDPFDSRAPIVTLRTVVPIDRVPPPKIELDEEDEELDPDEEGTPDASQPGERPDRPSRPDRPDAPTSRPDPGAGGPSGGASPGGSGSARDER